MDGTVAVLPNERALVAQAVAEPGAFAAIYDHYFPRVYNYTRYRVGDPQTADDVTAQVFERVLLRIDTYRPERGLFAAWLFAIARNAINDHLRAQRRHPWLSLDALRDRASPAPPPDDVVERDEGRSALLAATAHLSDRERELVALKFAAGLTNRHIGQLTGLGEGNVGVILYRAVRRLRGALVAEE